MCREFGAPFGVAEVVVGGPVGVNGVSAQPVGAGDDEGNEVKVASNTPSRPVCRRRRVPSDGFALIASMGVSPVSALKA